MNERINEDSKGLFFPLGQHKSNIRECPSMFGRFISPIRGCSDYKIVDLLQEPE